MQVNAEAMKIGKEADEANAIAAECQAGLDKALPALQSAEDALNVLTKKDMSELKVSDTLTVSFTAVALDIMYVALRDQLVAWVWPLLDQYFRSQTAPAQIQLSLRPCFCFKQASVFTLLWLVCRPLTQLLSGNCICTSALVCSSGLAPGHC